MVTSDVVIAAAYFSIPLTLMSFVRQRKDATHRGIVWLFSAFIAACGVTHVLDVWTIWQPDYGVLMLSKAFTAVVSLLTAVMLWKLIPQALTTPLRPARRPPSAGSKPRWHAAARPRPI